MLDRSPSVAMETAGSSLLELVVPAVVQLYNQHTVYSKQYCHIVIVWPSGSADTVSPPPPEHL